MLAKRLNSSGSLSRATSGIKERIFELLDAQLDFRRRLQRELGVDLHGLDVMIHLATHGNASPTEIAKKLDTSTAAASLILQRLESMGHISRGPDKSDRRKVVVSANKPSVQAAFAFAAPISQGTDELLQDMSESEIKAVAKFLDRLSRIYNGENLGVRGGVSKGKGSRG